MSYERNIEILRGLDPDEIVDALGLTSDQLVDELLEYIFLYSRCHNLEDIYGGDAWQ